MNEYWLLIRGGIVTVSVVLVLGTVSSGPWFDLRRQLGVALTKTSRR